MIGSIATHTSTGLGSLWGKAQSIFSGASAPKDEAFLQGNPWPALSEMGRIQGPLSGTGATPAAIPAPSGSTSAPTAIPAPSGSPSAPAAIPAPSGSTSAPTAIPAPSGSTSAGAAVGAAVGGAAGAVLSDAIKRELEGVVARLERKGFRFEERMTDGSIQDHLKNDRDGNWRFDAQLPDEKGSVTLMSLDDVRVLDGISGIGPSVLTQGERDAAVALEGLFQKGYERYSGQYHERIHPAAVLNTIRQGYPFYLYAGGATYPNTVKSPEQLAALAFFDGVGSSDALAQQDRAEMLKAAAAEGLKFHDTYNTVRTVHTAFCEGFEKVSLGRLPVAVDESRLADPARVKAHLQEVEAAWDKCCGPIFKKHHLGFEDQYTTRLGRMDDSMPLDVRMTVLAGLVEGLRQAEPGQGIFTHDALPIYEALRERTSDPGELLRMAGRITLRMGKMKRDELIEAARTSATLGAISQGDPSRSVSVHALLEATGSLKQLNACLDAMRLGTPQDLEERVTVMLELLSVLPESERDLVGEHYQNMTAMEGGTLHEKAEAYLKDLYAEQVTRKSATETSFSTPNPTGKIPAGSVESQGDFVVIGGVKVPRRGA